MAMSRRILLAFLLQIEFVFCRSLWTADNPEIVLPPFRFDHDSDESHIDETPVFRLGPQARTVLKTKYWTKGVVPYRLDKTYPPDDIDLIEDSMKDLQKLSCVKFSPWKKGVKDYIMIRNLHPCTSHIGKMSGRQGVSLGPRCMNKATILHELMHVLGFVHEHSRPDRDEHVEVNIDNVIEEYKHNFVKYEEEQVNTMGEDYDIVSIMHYDTYAYAIDTDIPTIVAVDPSVVVVGSQGNLTAADIRKLNKLYKCSS